ncbi:MAG: acyl-CoA dehydrogenase, partial [Nitratireductor sp.]
IQVLGGYGYTRDYPVERLYRDNRLNPIHEGTHGIQAMDLLGRKVTQAGGTGVKTLAAHLSETVATTGRLAGTVAENPRLGLANATIYLDMLGHVVIAWMWLRQAVVAAGKRANGEGNPDFLDGKLAACRYFFVHELPAARVKRELLDSLDDTTLTMRPAWF